MESSRVFGCFSSLAALAMACLANPCQKPDMMNGWLAIIKPVGAYVASLAVSALLAWHGCAELYRWYATGELLTRFDSGTRWAHWQLITYESHPFNFVITFAADALIAAIALAACVAHCLIIRKWWMNKPKAAAE
jgi:hypothetical protein